MIVAIVESLGHTCLQAASAREAIDLLQKSVVDLILLDIHLPGAKGNQFLKFIRARGTQVPVIVVSGYLQSEVVKEVTDLDVAAVLSKPIRVKRLAEELEKIFGSDS